MELISFLTSRRLALLLLILLLGVTGVEVALGLEKRGLNIYGSGWFLALSLLLLANLLACTVQRLWWWTKARRARSVGRELSTGRRKGFPFWRLNRGELMLLGSVLFHLGMAIVVAGALYDQLTAWRGNLYLTETQRVNLAPPPPASSPWRVTRQGPWGKVAFAGVALQLDKVVLAYHPDGTTREIQGHLTIHDYVTGMSRPVVLRMNYPIRYRGVKFIIRNFGFAPRFSLVDTAPRRPEVLAYSYVNLDFWAKGAGSEDGFEISPGLMLWARFYPALVWEKGFPTSKTTRLDNPWFRLRLEKVGPGEKTGRVLYDGWVKLGEKVTFAHYQLGVDDLHYWLELEASTERGLSVVVIGLWLGVFGLAVRYLPEFWPGLRPPGFGEKGETT